jgi:iron(III) transport system ATP-binding protein
MNTLLRVHNITKRFIPNTPPAVNDVSFEVGQEEIFALLGPSGCGKTTTLRLLAGFERADSGEVYLEDRLLEGAKGHVPAEGRGIGFVFQDYALFPHLNVVENVAFGLRKWSADARRKRVMAVLEMVGLASLKERKPHYLSGGEQQRVALARSLAPRPKLILLDEPFSNLDAGLRQTTREEVRALLKRAGMSAMLVTHDQEEALCFADRIAVMQHGRIEQTGTPEAVYVTPQTAFVADFLGKTNLIDGEAAGDSADTALGQFRLNCRAVGNVRLSIRPEHLTMVTTTNTPNGKIGEIVAREFKGHDLTYRVRVNSTEYVVQTDYQCRFRVGDRVCLKAVEPAIVVEVGHRVHSTLPQL